MSELRWAFDFETLDRWRVGRVLIPEEDRWRVRAGLEVTLYDPREGFERVATGTVQEYNGSVWVARVEVPNAA